MRFAVPPDQERRIVDVSTGTSANSSRHFLGLDSTGRVELGVRPLDAAAQLSDHGALGDLTVFCGIPSPSGAVHVILDVNGYYQ